MRILVLNGGSSSFKFWLGEISSEPIPAAQPAPLWEANVELTAASDIRQMLTPVLQRTANAFAPWQVPSQVSPKVPS